MRGLRFTFLLLLVLHTSGCVKEPIFIVLRDVPNNPSFTVIPVNDYLYQIEFATKIEEYLIQAGVKVVRHPASKAVETKKQLTQPESNVKQGAVAEATMTERYYSLEDTDADYVVETYADSKQVKIVRKASREIISAFALQSAAKGATTTDADVIHQALHSLGVQTRSNTKGVQ